MSDRYYGDEAVNQAAKYYGYNGPLDPMAVHIIREEGFVPAVYKDSKGIDTEGVGLTEEFMGKNFFTEVMPVFEQRASSTTKGWPTLPDEAKSAIVSMAYRGDWGPNTKKALSEGKWETAAKQYLDHDEYRKGKRKGATDAQRAISQRMERNAANIKALADES